MSFNLFGFISCLYLMALFRSVVAETQVLFGVLKKGHNWEPIIAALFSSFDKATIVCVVPTET